MQYADNHSQHWVSLLVMMHSLKNPWCLMMQRNEGGLPNSPRNFGQLLGGIPGKLDPGETRRQAAQRIAQSITGFLEPEWVEENGGTRMNWIPVCTVRMDQGKHIHYLKAWPSNDQQKIWAQLDGRHTSRGKAITHRVRDVIASPGPFDLDPQMQWVLPLALDPDVTDAHVSTTRQLGSKCLLAAPRWQRGEAVLVDAWDNKIIANVHPVAHQQAPDADGICELMILPDSHDATVRFSVRVPQVLLSEFVRSETPDGYQVQVQTDTEPVEEANDEG